MIRSFNLENRSTSKRVTFGQNLGFDYIYKDGDVDWGVAPSQHNTYSYPGQIGVSISNSMIKERDISISGYVYYVPTQADRNTYTKIDDLNDYVYSKIKEKKSVLNELVNPLETIRLYVNDYYIEGNPTQSVKYGQTLEENNEVFCRFLIELYCNNPGFKREPMVYENERAVQGKFHFPLTFDSNNPTVMSVRTDYNSLKVTNEGTLTVGGKIILSARSEIVNPVILNSTNNQRLKINKTMAAGEVITITTTDGSEKGIVGRVNGQETNYLKYWNFESEWIKFYSGVNQLVYTTDNESESFLDVSVELSPEKLALEEM